MARYEPVEDRGVETGDTVTVDLERRAEGSRRKPTGTTDVNVELGAAANPPGFDAAAARADVGRDEAVHRPATRTTTPSRSWPAASVAYDRGRQGDRRRVVPALDDEFAKDLGEFDTLDALRERVRRGSAARGRAGRRTAAAAADLLKELASRVTVDVPDALVEREMDRRTEEFARRLVDQQIDPQQTNIDWDQFREGQRDAGAGSGEERAGARRGRAARRARRDRRRPRARAVAAMPSAPGRTTAAVRARLEKEGGMGASAGRLETGEGGDFLLSRARIERE